MWFSFFPGFDGFVQGRRGMCQVLHRICKTNTTDWLALLFDYINTNIERHVHGSLQFECLIAIHCSLDADAVDVVDLLMPGSLKFRVLKHREDVDCPM